MINKGVDKVDEDFCDTSKEYFGNDIKFDLKYVVNDLLLDTTVTVGGNQCTLALFAI